MSNSVQKGKLWNKVRAKLKIQFLEWGITSCELKYDSCTYSAYVGFAHRYKRIFCDEEEMYIAVLACSSCHAKIEGKREDDTGQLDMGEIITNKINERNVLLRLRGFTVKDVVWNGPRYR